MRRALLISVTMLALVLGAVQAQAAFLWTDGISFSNDAKPILPVFPNTTYTSDIHSYLWNTVGPDGFGVLGAQPLLTSSATGTYTESVDGDPIKNMTENLTNDSDQPWVTYDITIVPVTIGLTVAFGPIGTASASGAFLDPPVMYSPTDLHFSGVASSTPLNPTFEAILHYQIILTPPENYSGSIQYLVIETPVPEPASLGLLGLGGLLLLRRRRR